MHYNDVSGYIRANYDFYKTITLPVETNEDRYYVAPISGETYLFKAGDVLWKNRMPASWLVKIKKEQGAKTYNSQFLQDPAPPGGNLIDTGNFRKWKRLPIRNADLMEKRGDNYKLVHSWDMAFKDSDGSDNVACSVFLTDETTTYLIDKFEKRIGFVKSLDAVVEMKEKWEFILAKCGVDIPIEILVEDKANGPAIIDVLSLSTPGIIPITPLEDKITRMVSIIPFIEAGNVLVPDLENVAVAQENRWWEEAEQELSKFPNVVHDDFSDSFSQGLRRIYVEKKKRRKRMKIW